MLTSLALIFLVGMGLGWLSGRLRLPALVGMIFTGMLLGPYALDLLDGSLLSISADLRQLALVIILTRAGLSLDLGDLKRAGRPAVLLCFVPACFEIAGTVLLAPPLLGVSYLEAAIIGSVIAAVSPAVIVPRMLRLMEEGYGQNHCIPQMILAGASVDDVFVIVLFTAFTSLALGGSFSAWSLLSVPVSILTGVVAGCAVGLGLVWFFQRVHIRDSAKILIILSISFLLLELEDQLEGILPLSGLLAIMALGLTINQRYPVLSARLSQKYNKLWVAAEVLLFVLVGATVDLAYVWKAGAAALLVLAGALVVQMLGVAFCMTGTALSKKERLFCMIAYTPQGHCTSSHRRSAAGYGPCLRAADPDGGGAGYPGHSAAGGLCYRFLLPEAAAALH